MRTKIEKGWQVFQDLFDCGEKYEIYKDTVDPLIASPSFPKGNPFQMDEWTDIPELLHLQVLLSDDPQLGKELRLYNAAPWWYRVTFEADAETAGKRNALRFDGVDYYCKVYLNGKFLGEHEGYQAGFSFDAPVRAGTNSLYVKVWSPLEFKRTGEDNEPRFFMVERRMLKGVYEHGDSLLHRDRNPVGIWRPVYLETCEKIRLNSGLKIDANPDGSVSLSTVVESFRTADLTAGLEIVNRQTGFVEQTAEIAVHLVEGRQTLSMEASVSEPKLWNTWDRGEANLYEARFVLGEIRSTATFGFRNVELKRTPARTEYYLNGKRLYIRGVSYYPDPYISLMHRGRILRDLELLKRGGCNMVRIHVHREIPELYELCDEMGIAVMQDTDFNWVHPRCAEWTRKAVEIVKDEFLELYDHPSILTWVIMNEPIESGRDMMGRYAPENYFMTVQPGPQMLAALKEADKTHTFILGSYCENDPESGDAHNYLGSIDGPADYFRSRSEYHKEKFNTEFGFDAPPTFSSLVNAKKVLSRLGKNESEIEAIQYYQYRFLKFSIESYRLCKYAPTAGHMQFMLADCSPMAYYGVIDYWGCAKPGYRAFLESNQPVGLFVRPVLNDGDRPSLVIVNDLDKTFENVRLCVSVTCDGRETVETQEIALQSISPDSLFEAGVLRQKPDADHKYTVTLALLDSEGKVLARNCYDDLYNHPHHPAGHPMNFSSTYGLRLF